jgi:hypothetical protein
MGRVYLCVGRRANNSWTPSAAKFYPKKADDDFMPAQGTTASASQPAVCFWRGLRYGPAAMNAPAGFLRLRAQPLTQGSLVREHRDSIPEGAEPDSRSVAGHLITAVRLAPRQPCVWRWVAVFS